MELKDVIFKHLETRIKNENALKLAEKIMENQLIVRIGHVPDLLDDIPGYLNFNKDFDWNLEIGEKTNMALFHLNAFEPIKYLIQSYEIDNNIEYLKKGIEIIKSWYSHTKSNPNKYNWYDHCVSERTLVVLLLKINLNSNEIYAYDNFLNEFLIKHQDFLKDQKNYTLNNHGLMMDRSLYILTKYLDNDEGNELIKLATNRMQELFVTSFSSNGINNENSISYQIFNLDLYLGIEHNLLRCFGDSMGREFESRIKKAIEYIAVFTQPDGKFPNIGDGERYNEKQIISRKMGHQYKKYLEQIKKKDKKTTNVFYPNEGYFYKNDGETYLSFVSGKTINTHKHGDDLSFTYALGDDDVIVDSGTYTYQKGPFRSHFMSPKAHNGLIVEDQGYQFISNDVDDVGLIHFEEKDGYSYVVGKNDSFDFININRHIVITDNGTIVVYDELMSEEQLKVSQNYNLHPDFNGGDIKVSNRTLKVSNQKSNRMLVMKQHYGNNILNEFGNIKKADYGLYSEKFHKISPINNLRFSSRGDKIVTSISYGVKPIDIEVILTENKMLLKENNEVKVVELHEDKREVKLDSYLKVKEIDHNTFEFECVDSFDFEQPEYAWYIFKDGKRIDSIWYQKDNILTYEFKTPGNYRIQYYILDKITKKKKSNWYHKSIKINL